MRVGVEMAPKLTGMDRRARKLAAVARYVEQAGRRAQKGVEPNDRKYSRDVERQVRQMSPAEFDALLHGDDQDG